MTGPSSPRDIAAAWRPQQPGRGDAWRIPDAIVEPAWGGARVAAALTVDTVALVTGGQDVAVPEELLQALLDAFRAVDAVIEGHLTTEALRSGEGVMPPAPVVERPPILIPRLGGKGARDEPYVVGRDHAAQAVALGARTLAALENGERHAFVATDLLWLDEQPLLDVPLLERKRLLEAILEESELVRVSAFVRPSAVITLVSWGTIGFRDLIWKAANSRYRPGEVNEDWAVGRAPQGPVGAKPTPPPR